MESLQGHHDARLMNIFFYLLGLGSNTDHIVHRDHRDQCISGKVCHLVSGR